MFRQALGTAVAVMVMIGAAAVALGQATDKDKAAGPTTQPDASAKAYLGVTTSEVPEILRVQLGLPKGFGLVIDSVEPGSPAERAGLKRFDVLHKINDQIIVNRDQLATLVESYKPGDAVNFTVIHKAKPTTVPIKLAATPAAIATQRHGAAGERGHGAGAQDERAGRRGWEQGGMRPMMAQRGRFGGGEMERGRGGAFAARGEFRGRRDFGGRGEFQGRGGPGWIMPMDGRRSGWRGGFQGWDGGRGHGMFERREGSQRGGFERGRFARGEFEGRGYRGRGGWQDMRQGFGQRRGASEGRGRFQDRGRFDDRGGWGEERGPGQNGEFRPMDSRGGWGNRSDGAPSWNDRDGNGRGGARGGMMDDNGRGGRFGNDAQRGWNQDGNAGDDDGGGHRGNAMMGRGGGNGGGHGMGMRRENSSSSSSSSSTTQPANDH